MSSGMVILTVVAVLIYFGVVQRVLDRMYLTDRAALLLVALMFVGTLLPNITVGWVSFSLGGAVIPAGVCVFLLVKAMNKLLHKEETVKEAARKCPYCKSVVEKDATRCPHCTSEQPETE